MHFTILDNTPPDILYEAEPRVSKSSFLNSLMTQEMSEFLLCGNTPVQSQQ